MKDNSSLRRRTGDLAAGWSRIFAAACLLSALCAIPFVDRLTSVLLVLSAFLFTVVCHYSARYMAGDPKQARFTLWLCLTGSCVFGLVIAQDLMLFALAWCGISLCLHQLLQFYRNRPGAILAARKKFLVSRLGDAALLGALVLTIRELGTTSFAQIFSAAARFRLEAPVLPPAISLIACLLVFAALLKSAQFPFHSWLPDTMETPTPVSALMHAGIINAGGILVIRLAPLVSLSHTAMLMLSVVGGFTALFASLVMLTQASVKRYLAFSTVAQMGFMMLECGLGAFHLALLHLVSHSLYKAWTFLSTGSAVLSKPRSPRPSVNPAFALGSLLLACGMSLSAAAALRVSVLDQPVLAGIFTLALTQMLWNFFQAREGTRQILPGLGLGIISSLAYFALDRAAGLFLPPVITPPNEAALPLLGLFTLAAGLQLGLLPLGRTSFAETLYVHARNGFYINTLANRLTTALWPLNTPKGETL